MFSLRSTVVPNLSVIFTIWKNFRKIHNPIVSTVGPIKVSEVNVGLKDKVKVRVVGVYLLYIAMLT